MALTTDSDLYSHLMQMAYAFEDKGMLDKAIETFGLAIECVPNDAVAYNSRGITYFKANKYDKALSDFETALRLDPDDREGNGIKAKVDGLRRMGY